MSFPINTMNQVLDAWRGDYDIFSKVPMQFQVDSQKRLCFNDDVLAVPSMLELESAAYTSERINFYFKRHQRLTISFSWPEDQAPVIEGVSFGALS